MSFIKEGDALVQRVQLYSEKHWLYHAYIFPFIIVYAIWTYAWLFENFYDLPHEAGMISLAVTFFIQVVIVLACHWSVHVMALVTCTKVSHPNSENATLAKFVPTTNNGSAELKRIHKSKTTGDIWVIFQKLTSGIHAHAIAYYASVRPVDFRANPLLHFRNGPGYFLWIHLI